MYFIEYKKNELLRNVMNFTVRRVLWFILSTNHILFYMIFPKIVTWSVMIIVKFVQIQCNLYTYYIKWKSIQSKWKKCSWIMTNEDDDIVKSNCAYLHSHALSFDVYPIYDDQTKLFFTFLWERPISHKGSFFLQSQRHYGYKF